MLNGYLRTATDSQAKTIGPFMALSDFYSVMTSLTLISSHVRISKNASAQISLNSGSASPIGHGEYRVVYDAVDTNFIGELKVTINVASAALVTQKFQVMTQPAYDTWFANNAPGYVNNYMATFAVASGSTTNNIITVATSPAAAVTNQFLGGVAVFDRATPTANLRGQRVAISGSTAGGQLACSDGLTTAPSSGDLGAIF